MPQPQPHQIQATCSNYTAVWATPDPYPLSEAQDQTHILMDVSWICNPLNHNGNSQIVFLLSLFFWPRQWHMDVPGPGIESNLHLLPLTHLWHLMIFISLCDEWTPLFTLLIVSFDAQRFLILIKSNLFSFAHVFVYYLRTHCQIPGDAFIDMFSSKTFMVLVLILRSFIYFEFISVYGRR